MSTEQNNVTLSDLNTIIDLLAKANLKADLMVGSEGFSSVLTIDLEQDDEIDGRHGWMNWDIVAMIKSVVGRGNFEVGKHEHNDRTPYSTGQYAVVCTHV